MKNGMRILFLALSSLILSSVVLATTEDNTGIRSCFSWTEASGSCAWKLIPGYDSDYHIVCDLDPDAPTNKYCVEDVPTAPVADCYTACEGRESGMECTCFTGLHGQTGPNAGHCDENNNCV